MKVYTKSEVDAAVEAIRRETAARMENFVGLEVQTITIVTRPMTSTSA